MEQGVIFDLEGILLIFEEDEEAKNQMVYTFLKEKKYVFHPDDFGELTPVTYAESLTQWREHDKEILDQEIGKFERNAMMHATGDPSAAGVLEAISRRCRVVVLSRSRGDGLIRILGKLGIRQYLDFIVPRENWLYEPSPSIGLELAMEKYPDIPRERWHYVGLPSSRAMADECGLKFYAFGEPPLEELEDVMDALL